MDGLRFQLQLALVLVAAVVLRAEAATVTVVNPSFESFTANGVNATLADGKFFYWNGGAGNSGLSGPFVIAGWSIVSNTGSTNAGLFNPGTANTVDGAVADGNQAAFLFNDFVIGQTLTATLQSKTTYTLTVAVRDRLDTAPAGYTITLLAGSTVLKAIDSVTSLAAPVIPTASNGPPKVTGIIDVSITYDSANASAVLIGLPLAIRLSSNTTGASQTLFDNVRLTAVADSSPVVTPVTPPAVPEPGVFTMVVVAGGVWSMRRK
jgi:hypothetical protein